MQEVDDFLNDRKSEVEREIEEDRRLNAQAKSILLAATKQRLRSPTASAETQRDGSGRIPFGALRSVGAATCTSPQAL